jgi:hypothetical protein
MFAIAFSGEQPERLNDGRFDPIEGRVTMAGLRTDARRQAASMDHRL